MRIEISKIFSVYLNLLHWGEKFVDDFTAVEKKLFTASFIAVC